MRAKIIVACAVGPIAAALSPRAFGGVQLTNVAAGSATVSQQGSVTTIRTGTNNTILYFSKFDIAGGSTVNFMQPSVAGRVLDHVTSATPSLINGTIRSNGSVYLINPAGVIFGAGAVVDVNRFYAAAANFSNEDFLRGVDHFTGVSGMVSNSGQIRANQVSLVGSQVMNAGNIIAPNGYVAMLAGSDVLVSEEGSHITAKVSSPGPVAGGAMGAAASAAAASSVKAGSFDLRNSAMAAGDVYSLAIRHTGTIQASNVVINGGGGKVEVSGTIDASSHAAGAVGGNVAITGGEVDLASANINASGPGGGGTIEIGGGLHGGGDLAHAQIVSVDSSSVIDADAVSNGAGGTVALWSDGTTSDAGTITARGGMLGGNGGLIETSGAALNVISAPNASAPHGTAGTWLLDPLDVEIVNAADDGTQLTGSPASNVGGTVNNGSIETALEAGTNVIISTDQAGAGTGILTQDATAPIAVTLANAGAVSLTLQANAGMTLSGGISTGSGSTALNVELDGLGGLASTVAISAPIDVNGSLTIKGGALTVMTGGDLTAASVAISGGPVTGLSTTVFPSALGAVIIDAPITTTAGGVSITTAPSIASAAGGKITAVGGNVTLSSTGAITIGDVVNTGGGAFTATGTSFSNTAGISDGGTNGSSTVLTVNTTAGLGTINIGGAISWAGTGGIDIEGATTVTTSASGTIATTGAGPTPVSLFTTGIGSNGVTLNGTVNASGLFSASGAIFTLPATSSVTAGSASINLLTTSTLGKTLVPNTTVIDGPVSTTAAGGFGGGGVIFTSNATGTISTSGGGGVSITTSSGTTIGGIVNTGGGAFTVAAGLDFENDAAITVGNGTASSTAFSVTTSGSGTIDINGAITWTGTGGVTISGANQVTTTPLGTITSAGAALMPVSLFTTFVDGSIGTTGVTIGAGVTTTGAFTASGGNFILSANVPLTAGSVSLNMPSTTPVTVPNTVTISGPILATINGGAINIGGAVLVVDNTTGTLTSTDGPISISNTGLVGMGNAIATGGGAFTVNNSSGGPANFSTSGAPITTSGGNVSITTSTSEGAQISTDSPVNTGGGSFTVSAQAFENDSAISDGGVATTGGVVNIDTTSGTGALNINGTISWTGGIGRNVDIEGGGTVSVVSIISSGATALPVTVFTTATGSGVTISGAVNTTGTFVSSGSSVNVSSAGSITAQAVSLNITTGTPDGHTVTPGAASVAGPITTNGGTFTAGGTSFSSSGAGLITTNGGDVNLLTPDGINLGGAIVTGGGAFNATNDNAFTSTTGGTITTLGGAVTINSIGTVGNSTGEIVIGDEINTGGGAFTSNGSTFTSSGEITDGGINDNQPVSITTTGGDITLNTGGDINWAASLGSITFVVPAGSTLGLGATITGNVAEPINFTGVTLSLVGPESTIMGGNIAFGTISNPDDTTAPALAVKSAGTVSLGIVGTTNSPIGSFTVEQNGTSAQPVTTLSGDINSSGIVDFAGPVILAADISVITSDLAASPVEHLIEFDGTINGAHGLTVTVPNPPAPTQTDQNPPSVEEIRFNSNIGDQTPLAFLNVTTGDAGILFFRAGPPGNSTNQFGNLPGVDDPQPLTVINIASGGSFKVNDGPPPSPKQSAIIISDIDSYGPLTVNIGSAGTPNAANLYAVGQYEKLTSFGDLNINTNGGTAQIGDLSSFGNMTVDAANITFLLRQPTFENNVALDKGVDLIASGEMTLPANAVYTAITPSGTGAFGVPGFLAGSFNPSSNFPRIAASLDTAISNAPSIPASTFFFPGFNLLLDLTPSTLSSKLPSFVAPIPSVFDLPAGGAFPRQQLVAGTVTPDFKNAMMPSYPGPTVQQDLNDDGVFTREPTVEEIVDATDSVVVYNDTPRKRRPRAEDFSVAVTRLNSSRAQQFLDQYHEIFAAAPGSSANTPSHRAQIASDLQESWDAYVGQNGYKRATGAGFQHYVATTRSASKAANELTQLNSLLQQLDTLGLSHKEAQMAFQHNVLAGLPANGMQDGDLIAAVEKSGSPE
jgi:filamentous hemagglutinin family protein